MTYRVGIDAGSKTIKVVILDEQNSVIYTSYKRHRAAIKQTLYESLHNIDWQRGNIEATFAMTGSAGIEIAAELGIPFVQEVVATTQAVREGYPQADAIIELGGEDAKVIYLSGGLEQRMNATCAGGTGGFIDNIAFMLGIRSSQFDRVAMGATQSYPIASRCAVFAQTDVRPLLNAGVSKADIAASTYDAVVRQTIGGLACGRPIKGTVVFLGGPLEHMSNLTNRFRKALELDHETGIKPPDAHLFTARGAAILSERECDGKAQPIKDLIERLQQIEELEDDLGRLEPLFASADEIDAFRKKHDGCSMETARLSDAEGPLYLGIDAGSTTVKLAVLDEEKRLVYHDYQPVGGDTVHTLRDMLHSFYIGVPHPYGAPERPNAWVAHATATGYGEELLKAAFGVDSGIVETTAHLRAALHICPEASFVFDIGGQDMKAIWIDDGQVSDSVLNEACSSGCGSFIEGTAHSLHSNKYRFADAALRSESPVDLGTKCTVFMSSRVKHAQKIGVKMEDIAAGVAYSVVRNALYRIIGADRVATMGDHVVVQGGTFMSDAVLRAFEKISGAEVFRPKQADLMGAIGAALVAYDRAKGDSNGYAAEAPSARLSKMFANRTVTASVAAPLRSGLISDSELLAIDPKRRVAKCPGCGNACTLSIVSFGGGRTYVSGNKCAIGETEGSKLADASAKLSGARAFAAAAVGSDGARAAETATSSSDGARADALAPLARKRADHDALPNIVALERKLIDGYSDLAGYGTRSEIRIGLMNTLNMRAYVPFWHTLLHELGFSIVVADAGCETFAADRAWESVPSESVCYPAKISHARHHNMARKDADAIFMAQFERGNNCPVTSSYASALKGNTSENPLTLAPFLASYQPKAIMDDAQSLDALLAALNEATTLASGVDPITEEELSHACAVALRKQDKHEGVLVKATEKALDWLHDDDSRHALLLVGRPYHVDEAVIHGIDEELGKLGFAVLSMSGLTTAKKADVPKFPSDWVQSKRAMRAAAFAAGDSQIDVVFLQSFGCLYDAMSIEDAHGYLKQHKKQSISLKIDDINDIVHTRIRLRTMAEAIEAQKRKQRGSGHSDPAGAVSEMDAAARAEDVEPAGDAPVEGAAQAAGDLPPAGNLSPAEPMCTPLCSDDLETARCAITRDLCFSVTAMAARVVREVQSNSDITCVKLPRICQGCMLDAIPRLVKRATDRELRYEWADEWPDLQCGSNVSRTAGPDALHDCGRARIGIVGNPLIVFDPFMNDHAAELISSLGCEPVFPNPELLFVEDVRYIDQLRRFQEQGITDVVYMQSFGCLKGHVSARGAIRSLKRDFPDINITVLDYDPEASALNRENRIRLVAEAAKERCEHSSRQDAVDIELS